MQACPGVLPPAARAQPVCAIQPLASNFPPVTAGSTDATPERMAYAKDVIPDQGAGRPRSVNPPCPRRYGATGPGAGRPRTRLPLSRKLTPASPTDAAPTDTATPLSCSAAL